jgi:hypothetical protein
MPDSVDLEQPAKLTIADLGREYVSDYDTGWGAITAAGWAIHLGRGVPQRIVLANGDVVGAEQMRAEHERAKARGDYG